MSKRHFPALISGLLLAPFVQGAGAEGGAHHWSYQGGTGPTHWAGMESDFKACGIGHAQSRQRGMKATIGCCRCGRRH